MKQYNLIFCDEQGNKEILPVESDNFRYLTSEARDLQRNLSEKQKEDHCYYAVIENFGSLIYSAYGY
jgi:hypothetical protein